MPVSGVKVPTKLTLVRGKTATLSATVSPANATDQTVTWISKSPAIAAVNPQTGKVSALKSGRATIEAITRDGGFVAQCAVTVTAKAVPLKSLTVTPNKPANLVVGGTLEVKTKLTPANATGVVVKYSSSAVAVATVDDYGVITARQPGKTTITVKAGGKSKKIALTVGLVRANRITLSHGGKATLTKGKKLTLSVNAFFPEETEPKTITWSSADRKIATVSGVGVVKGVKKGKTTITATAWNGVVTRCVVTVK